MSALVVLSCLLTGCSAAPPATGPSLSAAELRLARSVVSEAGGTFGATLTSAFAQIVGPETDSNTGHTCTSQRLVQVTLVGTFAGVNIGGTSTAPGGGSPQVQAMIETADPASGQVCLISVTTTEPSPGPDATSLLG
jgi:hypothetical protein